MSYYASPGPNVNFKDFWDRCDAERETVKEQLSQKELEEQIAKLKLVCVAMWSIIMEKTNATEEELIARVKEIDLKDGTQDGKITNQVFACPQCNRVISPKHNRCLYCGFIPPTGDFAAFNMPTPVPNPEDIQETP